jgi:AcrR family transcriptional regulator
VADTATPPTPTPTPTKAGGGRRSPAPGERQRDAERSRRRILDAALEVFGAKGFAGARVAEIAERAGVNHQLISYYFGGKEGLYDELLAEWHRREAEIGAEDLAFDELVVAYLTASHERPDMARLLVWDGLTASRSRPRSAEGGEGGEAPEVADLRRRRSDGEIADDLDPGFLLLALMAAVAAGTTMPEMATRLTGLDPDSPDFVERYGDQLRRLVRHLRAR